MSVSNLNGVMGHNVEMKINNNLHYDDKQKAVLNDDVSTSFKDMFSEAIGKVNKLQVDSEELQQRMIYEPDSVDIHEVMIAQQKAEIALTFTKTVRDEALKSYKELMNLR